MSMLWYHVYRILNESLENHDYLILFLLMRSANFNYTWASSVLECRSIQISLFVSTILHNICIDYLYSDML